MLVLPVSTKNDNHQAPYGCIGLVLANIFIFFFLQSGDGAIRKQAYEYRESSGLLAIEVAAYRDYLLKKGEFVPDKITEDKKIRYQLAMRMANDETYNTLLEKNRIIDPEQANFNDWREKRDRFEEIKNRSITDQYGYSPQRNNRVGLFTHMFLHGGIMHLVGNMVFLWLVGAFLETAIGAISFLALYLVTGICAGSLFGMIYPLSPGPLVGASGAISGLMGAYGVVFGMRKIRVFYSLGFYFDYANVPALSLFPVWLGNEFLQLYTTQNSHVAYMAHIGGLVSGIACGAGCRFFKKDRIESLFHQEEQKSLAESLYAGGMEKLAALDMKNARIDFNQLQSLEPDNLRAIRQLFRIDKCAPHSEEFHQSAHRLLHELRSRDADEYLAVFEEYRKASGKPRVTVEILEQLSHLYLGAKNINQAASCISILLKRVPENSKIPGFLFSLARGYQHINKEEARKCLRILAARYPNTFEGQEAEKIIHPPPR
ncbi:MAG: rhomboid family intramembrane serine protease [Pseudomonadota bacterium]